MKSRHSLLIEIVLICLLVSACKPVQPTATRVVLPTTALPTILPTPRITETTSPTATPEPGLPDTTTLRIRLSTSSDWTALFLISGATWLSHELISAGEEGTTAEILEDQLFLNQPIARAEAGAGTEMIVDILFAIPESGGPVRFKIERGDIGSTLVEFSRYVMDEWVVIKAINWDRINGDGVNAHYIEIAVPELFIEMPSPTAARPGAVAVSPVTGMPRGTDGYPWWNDTVFYEIFVRSFFDSNGDGIGDFNGLTEKLDYLNDGNPNTSADLGITGIWLMPIYPSPSYHGYNVTDFYAVNPEFGTMDDFTNLLNAAHARGIRVILDITLNHTSTQHPWFIEACDPNSPYHDWYIWSDDDPGYRGYWGQQVWFPYNNLYFYSTFSANFADLNYNNPEVQVEMQNVVRFWLEDIGVDGFRLDAAKHMIEEGSNQANTAATHTFWENFRTFYKQINPLAITVGEIWDTPEITAEYLQGDEFDLAFDFYLAYNFIQPVNDGNSLPLNDQIELSYTSVPSNQFATFLTNHDQDRVMSQLGNDPQRAMVAASLMLTAPGVPFLYYGEEIGMTGQKPDERIRSPMQWSIDPFAGFSTGSPWQSLQSNWGSFNVESETNDPASILSHYRNLILIRSQHAALRAGDLNVLTTGNDALYAILRISQQEAVLVLVNLSGSPVSDYALGVAQSSLADGSYMSYPILGEGVFAPVTSNASGGFSQYVPIPEIAPYATIILQLQMDAP
jgi:alpha-amylase